LVSVAREAAFNARPNLLMNLSVNWLGILPQLLEPRKRGAMNRSQSVVMGVAAVALLGLTAGISAAAVIPVGFNTEVNVWGTSDVVGTPFDVYNESVEYAPASEPHTVSLDRSGEVTSGGQTSVRMSSTATQTSSVLSQPLDFRATAAAAFTAHIEQLSNYTGRSPSVGAVSDFEAIVEVTDGPARYSFSGTLFGLSSASVSGTDPPIFERGPSSGTSGEAFNLTGTIQPGRYSFRINASGGIGTLFPGSGDSSGSVRDVALRVTQVPEPAAGPLAAAAAATLLRRCRARGDNVLTSRHQPRRS